MLRFFFIYLLKNLDLKQTIIKNSFWLAFSRLLGSLLRAVLVILGFRILGPDYQGSFYLAMNFLLIFSVVTDFGFIPIFIKSLQQKKIQTNEVIANFIYTYLIFFILTAILILFGKELIIKDELSRKIILALIPFIFFETFRELLYSLFRAREKMELQAFSYIFTNFFLFVFGLLILIKFPHPLNLALAYLFSSFLGFIFTLLLLKRDLVFNYFKFIKVNAPLEILRKSWPIGVANLIFLLITYLDTLILGYFRNREEVGIYNSIVKINELLFTFPAALAMSVYPKLTKGLSNNEDFLKTLEFGLNFALLVSIPLFSGIFFLSKDLIHLLYGDRYLVADLGLKFLSFSIPFNFLSLILINTIIALNKRRELLKFDFLILLINILLNLMFIPNYGFYASSLITSLSSFFSFVSSFIIVRKYINISLYSLNLIKPFIASVIMGLIILYVPMVLLLKIIIAILLYIIFLWFLNDKFLKDILKK